MDRRSFLAGATGAALASADAGPSRAQDPATPPPRTGESKGNVTPTSAEASRITAHGPLEVSAANPRYFAVRGGDGRAVYLTGSHIWNNFHDGLGPGPVCAADPERNDYAAYLEFLAERGHNFVRLWRWEHVRSQAAGGAFHLCMAPQPWARTGPGDAVDGGPRFDLDRLDPAYFARLRERVAAAGERGIYVAVMLFEGWALHLSPAPDNVAGHPFHAANNVSGVAVASIDDVQVLPLDPRVQAVQDAYVRAVVDAVHDLPNVLWEVANESSGGGTLGPEWVDTLGLAPDQLAPGDSTAWQYRVIELVKAHERAMGYDPHPIGMTMQFPVPDQARVNDPLWASSAEWVSPGFDDGAAPIAPDGSPSRWYSDPPANDGRKVSIADTDHFAPGLGDALWAWKTFLRGHHPILMDFGIIDVADPLDPSLGVPPFAFYEPARLAMGDTRRYAERIDLAAMAPRGDLASTGYALADPGREYLVLQPDAAGGPFTVWLTGGTYTAEWFAVDAREATDGADATASIDGEVRFAPPANGPAVLHLVRAEG